jgi:aspartate carbamoyltransferase catalytic subunit
MSPRARRDVLGIRELGRAGVVEILERAAQLKATPGGPRLAGKVVANLFFEDSTRTRLSFETAAKSLGAEVLNWTARGSSVSKGETLVDTARNIAALGVHAIVVRHSSSGAAHLLARAVGPSVLNAGDGTHEHPSQALLDAFTMQERLGSLQGRRVAIVGDILHSRVARSNVLCLGHLGAQVVLCGPPTMMPQGVEALGAEVSFDFDRALERCDAVMMLRIQLERQAEALFPSPREYTRRYGLTVARAQRLKEGAVILHPGPMNRGLEIADEVADWPRSVILHQVANGVFVRQALLERCLS